MNAVSVGDYLGVAANDTAAFSLAFAQAESLPHGGVVHVPCGEYTIESTISNDRSADPSRGRVSLVGEDQYGVRINYIGAGSCFYFAGSPSGPGEGNAAYTHVSNMTLVGPSQAIGSSAITIDLGAFSKLTNLLIDGFDYGLYLQDVDQFYAEKLSIRFNRKGIFCRKRPGPTSASTQPNNHTYVSCAISNNLDYGGVWVGGSDINFFGGDVEYNGSDASGFGLKFIDCGYEGGRGCNLQGVYFEGNAGLADVVLEAFTQNTTPLLSVVHTVASSFKRLPNDRNAAHHILCGFGWPHLVGRQSLVMLGSSFRVYPGYLPSEARKAVAFSNFQASSDNFFDFGSFYESDAEKPAFAKNRNSKDVILTRAANQGFASGVPARWLIDSAWDADKHPLWVPSLSGGELIITESGTYSLSAYLALTTAAPGLKVIAITCNGAPIAGAESSSAVSFVSAAVVCRLALGDKIAITYQQNTGITQSVGGSSVARSNLTIVKHHG